MTKQQLSGFDRIVEEFSKGRNGVRKIGLNTYLEKLDDNKYGLRYHQTYVVIYYPDKVEISAGGWFTSTTKERINNGLHLAGLIDGNRYNEVHQDRNIWYLGSAEKNPRCEEDDQPWWINRTRVPFFEGIQIDYDGNVLNNEVSKYSGKTRSQITEEKRLATLKDIDKYMRGLSKAIDEEKLKGTSGDCWFCLMHIQEGKSLGEVSNNDHIQEHVKEKYYMVSMIDNALEKRGYRYPGLFITDEKNEISTQSMIRYKDVILRAVRWYLKRELLRKS